MGGGGGGGGVDAFGMGVVKGGNIVQDVAMGTGAPTPLFISATLEADPEIMERHDAFLDGLEMRLMQMAGV